MRNGPVINVAPKAIIMNPGDSVTINATIEYKENVPLSELKTDVSGEALEVTEMINGQQTITSKNYNGETSLLFILIITGTDLEKV